ncbi:MAG: hypothetical protein JRJ87_14720 [Deltaproteobacteria bacterium]|nr:hypothetical protein [Deltaproteobacteria bacterium]
MNLKKLQIWITVLILLVGGTVLAGSIYLNGVRIDGVTNQKFEKCTVTIDAKGDVHIDAPGFAVESKTGTKQPVEATTAAKATGRYWLVKEENYPGKTQYDVDIYINNVWFKRIRSNQEQIVLEISKYLRPGSNVLHFAATKNVGKTRKSFSPQSYMRIIIGEGNIGGNNVMIDNPLIKYSRNASETQDFNDEYTITVK